MRAIWYGSLAMSLMILATLWWESGGSSRNAWQPPIELIPPYAVAGFLIALIWRMIWRWFEIGSDTVRPNLCWECDYDLTGNLSGRCPECGASIPIASPE